MNQILRAIFPLGFPLPSAAASVRGGEEEVGRRNDSLCMLAEILTCGAQSVS